MAFDTSIFKGRQTLLDKQKLQEAFDLQKATAAAGLIRAQRGANLPAALQLANEYQTRLENGDLAGANLIAQFAKTQDRGIQVDQSGNYIPLQGYGDAVGQIAGQKQMYVQNAQNQSDMAYKPVIARDVAQQQANVDLGMKPSIEKATTAAKAEADAAAGVNKKASSAKTMMSLTDQARQILKGVPDESGKPTTMTPTGSYAGAGLAFGKRFIGMSDKSTQANTALDAIAGNLTASVPRMEGPQSNFDVQNYEKMAGRVNDRTLPIGDRLSALDEIDKIQAKYAYLNDPMAASQNAISKRNQELGANPYGGMSPDASAAIEELRRRGKL
jgi:type II secretory pathway component GspD/PulD (secretin)